MEIKEGNPINQQDFFSLAELCLLWPYRSWMGSWDHRELPSNTSGLSI